ncbi:hypothetical protein DBR06_SOUSAS8010139, partial [Sousa chinensis]
MNQEIKMQAAAFKNKKRGSPANEGADDPAYENITFKTQHQPKGSHSPPKNKGKQPPTSPHHTALEGARGRDKEPCVECWALEMTCPASTPVPAQSKPASDPAQVPHWLPRATMSLYVLLVLSCVVLLAFVLVKNSKMSQELLVLRTELQKVSLSVGECQDEEKKRWNDVKQGIDTVKSKVHEGNQKLKTLAT